jgi:hypothetical protein
VDSDSDPEETQLLPLHRTPGGKSSAKGNVGLGLANVWDEREELFGIGESDEEGGGDHGCDGGENGDTAGPPPPPPPKILVTAV